MSVSAVVVDAAGSVLAIQRRDNGHWEPPGGVLEPGETIEAGLIREVREETGLVVDPVALTGVYKHVDRGIVALVFRCTVRATGPCDMAETIDMRWMPVDEVAQTMQRVFAVRVLDAVRGSGQPTASPPQVRNHNGSQLVAG